MSRQVLKQMGIIHLEYDGVDKDYIVMPDRNDIESWEHYGEDRQEAEDRYKELVKVADEAPMTIGDLIKQQLRMGGN